MARRRSHEKDLTNRTDLRARARRILATLRKLYPGATTELEHTNAFELLVATILSAQSTDANVNRVLPALLAKYPDARALAIAEPADLERAIHSTGFFRQKTRSLLGASQRIVEDFGGEVPDTMDGLLALPGVARKTANVVLGTWFRKNEGVVVDTHVGRVARRLELTASSRDEKDAVVIERDLMVLLPRTSWAVFGHGLTLHGRRVCQARKPQCESCRLTQECPSAFRVDRAQEAVRRRPRSPCQD